MYVLIGLAAMYSSTMSVVLILIMCLTSFTDNVKGRDMTSDSYKASMEASYRNISLDYYTSESLDFGNISLPILYNTNNLFSIVPRRTSEPQYFYTTTVLPEINTDDLMDRISNFTNDVQRDIVSNQLRYCPYTDLCTVSSLLMYNYTYYPTKDPCCQRCSCDRKTCFIYQTCCPDIMQYPIREMLHDNNKQLVDIMGTVAVDGQAKRSCLNLGINSKYMIVGIGSCPDPTSGYSFKCTREYTSDIDILIDIVPCYGKASLDIYRNRFCAYCNGLSDKDIVFFEPELECTMTPSIEEISDVRQLLNLVLVGGASSWQSCNLKFKHALDLPVESCISTQNRCNMTGHWANYSLEIEMACRSYSSLITYEDTLFENIFCLICNGYSVGTVAPLCHIFGDSQPFSGGIFSFSGLLKIEETGVETETFGICSHNELYDDQKVNKIDYNINNWIFKLCICTQVNMAS